MKRSLQDLTDFRDLDIHRSRILQIFVKFNLRVCATHRYILLQTRHPSPESLPSGQ